MSIRITMDNKNSRKNSNNPLLSMLLIMTTTYLCLRCIKHSCVYIYHLRKTKHKAVYSSGGCKDQHRYYCRRPQTTFFLQNVEHTCVFSSLASGLMYLKDKKASDFILQHIESSEDTAGAIGCAMMLLTGCDFRYSAKI